MLIMSHESSPLALFSKKLSFSLGKRQAANHLRVHSIDDCDHVEEMQFVEVTSEVFDKLPRLHTPKDSLSKTHEDDSYVPEENIALSQFGKIEREREIFLRAALQLLEQESRRDAPATDTSSNNNAHTKPVTEQVAHNLRSSSSNGTNRLLRGSMKHKHPQCDMSSDIIRYGILRKAGRNGIAFSSLKPQWKNRYVELRYGKFIYEHEASNMHWGTHIESTNHHHRKEIVLTVDTCQCRPFKIRSPNGSCVFELTHYGGPRRLWMAGSERERDLWVTAILKAMVGSLDDQLGIGHELRLKVFTRQVEIAPGVNDDNVSTHSRVSEDPPASAPPNNHHSHHHHHHTSSEKNPRSWDGPAAAFAEDIARFVTVQTAVYKSIDAHNYQNILHRLRSRHINISIPVYYVKSHASVSNFAFSTQDTLNRQTLQAVETSQIWKDLQRDTVAINGELIRGESGTEAMVGALMRHIMDRVEIIRSTDEESLSNVRDQYNNYHNKHKVFSRFDITEAQTLACARDILMLCNRTQSGGDTYFCIDALLCDKSKDLCIITPLAAEADPITISVDLVKGVDHHSNDNSSRRHNQPSPLNRFRSRSVAAVDGLDADSLLSPPDLVDTPASSSNRPSSLLREHHHTNRESYDSFDDADLPQSMRASYSSENLTNKYMSEDSTSSSPMRYTQSAAGTPLKERYRRNTDDIHIELRHLTSTRPPSSKITQSRQLPDLLQPDLVSPHSSSGQPSPLDSYPMTVDSDAEVELELPDSTFNQHHPVLDSNESSTISVSDIMQTMDDMMVSSESMSRSQRCLLSENSLAAFDENASVVSDVTGHGTNRHPDIRPRSSTNPTSSSIDDDQPASSSYHQHHDNDEHDQHSIGDLESREHSVDGDDFKMTPSKHRFRITTATGKSFFKSISKSFTPSVSSSSGGAGVAPPLTSTAATSSMMRHNRDMDTSSDMTSSTYMDGTNESRGSTISNAVPPSPSPFAFFRSRSISNHSHNNSNSNDYPPPPSTSTSTADLLKQLPTYTAETLFSPMRKVASIASAAAQTTSRSSSLQGPHTSNISDNSHHNTSNSSSSNYWIRVEVKVNSRYRVCDSNPQDDNDSTWGEVQGQFRQCFFIQSGCEGRPVLSDRVVCMSVDKLNLNAR